MTVTINFMSAYGYMLHQAIKALPTSKRKWFFPNKWDLSKEDLEAVNSTIVKPYYFSEEEANKETKQFLEQFDTNKITMW